MRLVRPVLITLGTVLLTAGAPGASQAQPSPVQASARAPLSQRVVAYQVQARLDPNKKTIDATETLTYHNLTGHALEEFPLHLYLNAFQSTSTFMREVRLSGTRGTGCVSRPKAGAPLVPFQLFGAVSVSDTPMVFCGGIHTGTRRIKLERH